jgi:hypothetical protein
VDAFAAVFTGKQRIEFCRQITFGAESLEAGVELDEACVDAGVPGTALLGAAAVVRLFAVLASSAATAYVVQAASSATAAIPRAVHSVQRWHDLKIMVRAYALA